MCMYLQCTYCIKSTRWCYKELFHVKKVHIHVKGFVFVFCQTLSYTELTVTPQLYNYVYPRMS